MIKRERLTFLLCRLPSTTTESHCKVTIEVGNGPGGWAPIGLPFVQLRAHSHHWKVQNKMKVPNESQHQKPQKTHCQHSRANDSNFFAVVCILPSWQLCDHVPCQLLRFMGSHRGQAHQLLDHLEASSGRKSGFPKDIFLYLYKETSSQHQPHGCWSLNMGHIFPSKCPHEVLEVLAALQSK